MDYLSLLIIVQLRSCCRLALKEALLSRHCYAVGTYTGIGGGALSATPAVARQLSDVSPQTPK
jgi:hypothetical protein